MIWFWKVMLKLTPIDSRLEIQCNKLPNNNAIANVYQDMFPFKNNRNSSRARQPLFRWNVTGFTTPIESLSLRKKKHTHTLTQTSLKIGFAKISFAAQQM